MSRLAVVGAGPMGLAAAHFAVRAGFEVEVIEAGDRVGGMAAHFDFDGLSLERFYHFCCLSDDHTLDLLRELGLEDEMRWVTTTMGFFVDGELHEWGNPIALLKFPGMSLIEKARYGLQAFYATKRSDWRKLDGLSAQDWFVTWCGQRTYDRMWRPLLEYKFYQHAPTISAAWMWQRMKRLGNSRKSLFEERLGYIEGGSERLMNALAARLTESGARIHLSAPAARFRIEDGAVSGVELADGRCIEAPLVISTVPMPAATRLLRNAPAAVVEPYRRIDNIGVVCVLLKLRRRVSPHFWVNITGSDHEVPGIVEFSNLRPLPDHVVYVPFYMPTDHPKFNRENEAFLRESMSVVSSINPELSEDDVLATHVARLSHAQPICDVGFAAKIPPLQTPIRGLQIADTCFYYPEDRGISESIGLARRMVASLSTVAQSPR